MENEGPNQQAAMQVLVLLACHNRREKTLECLRALQEQRLPDWAQLKTLLIDDGSTDGTSEAVAKAYPGVRILQRDGSLFWAGGMRLGMSEALNSGADLVLWLNDDTLLFQGALERLFHAYQRERAGGKAPILVGATCDRERRITTYGGVNLGKGIRRLRFVPLPVPETKPVICDTMNGNCVLIPMVQAHRLGGIHPAYRHALGDFDFGLRATRSGIPILVIPGWVGVCDWNSAAGTMSDPTLPLAHRWKLAMGVKGLPPGPWWRFVRTHGGGLSPLYFAWPYLKLLAVGSWTDLREGRLLQRKAADGR